MWGMTNRLLYKKKQGYVTFNLRIKLKVEPKLCIYYLMNPICIAIEQYYYFNRISGIFSLNNEVKYIYENVIITVLSC